MNKLFSLLMQGNEIPDSFAWYAKRTDSVPTSDRITALVGFIMTDVPVARMALYAAMLCHVVMMTQYGPQIKKLDPHNTYFIPLTRPFGSDHSDPKYCVHDLIKPVQTYNEIVTMLNDDIVATLNRDSWFDMMGAACLQLLREAANV